MGELRIFCEENARAARLRAAARKMRAGGKTDAGGRKNTLRRRGVYGIIKKMTGAAAGRKRGRGERMLRIAIVEDDAACMEQLRQNLTAYAKEKGEEFRLDCFAAGMDLMENYRPVYDLILLDIEMPHFNGMETARRIRRTDEQVLLMFVTNTAQYAVQGYEVGAVDYLLKPVNYYALALKMDRVLRISAGRQGSAVAVNRADGQHMVSTRELCYVEVQNHELCYHLTDRTLTATGSLKELESQLAGQGFARCHNCYLVNLRFVESIQPEFVVVHGDRLKISRARRKAFLQAMLQQAGV